MNPMVCDGGMRYGGCQKRKRVVRFRVAVARCDDDDDDG